MKRLLAATVVVLAASATGGVRVARAAPSHSVRATVDNAYVGVGEILRYSITLRTHGALEVDASSPGKIDGFDLVGQSQIPGQSMIMQNGVFEQYNSFTVTYRLRAKKPGKYTLGPGKFVIGGKPMTTNPIAVEVFAGAVAHDPLEDLLNQHFDEPPPPPKAEPLDPLARIDALPTSPSEREFFIRVVPNERRPVLGEQVTLKVFVYARHPPEVMPKRPPVASDFRIVGLGSIDKIWHPITISDQTWSYAALEGHAVFPLRAGKLTVGPTVVSAAFRDFFGKSGDRDYESPSFEIEAVEPPAEGRPSGYVLGDVVGNLQVKADLTPRKVVDGHALLTLAMTGAGRLDPLRPVLPTPSGLTWTNTGDETHATVAALTVNGARKLQVDARFDRTGDFDLGDAVVHVWDPGKRAYVSVRAALGTVHVERAAEQAKDDPANALPPLPPPRGVVGASGEGQTLADRPWTWGVVFGAPLAVVLTQLGVALTVRRKKRAEERADDPEQLARAALADARAGKDVLANSVRAIDRALEAATNVRARGLTRSELSAALADTSLSSSLRARVVDAFEALENARFAGIEPPPLGELARLVDELLASRVSTPEGSP